MARVSVESFCQAMKYVTVTIDTVRKPIEREKTKTEEERVPEMDYISR